MSLTLGEKLRQAREERGISISEVAEQTRISAMYLELIENDDYRTLPGGIFNKGFVKSYAKYVGLDEQEALADYARLMETGGEEPSDHLKVYKPEVLTDDRTSSSMIPTIIFAVIILGLMTWGILALVNYIQENQNRPAVSNTNTNSNVNSNTADGPTAPKPSTAPSMGSVKIEFKAVGDSISLSANADGKMSAQLVAPDAVVTFEPKESLVLSYHRSKATNAQLTINGKQITLPSTPANSKRNAIEITLNNDNLAQTWESGEISFGGDAPAGTPVPAPATTPVRTSRPTNTPEPEDSPAANVTAKPSPTVPRPSATTARPSPTVPKPTTTPRGTAPAPRSTP